MADYDRRQGGGGYNPRKRRHREDDDHQQSYRDQRGPRRRHEPPVPSRLRKQIIDLADNPLRRVQEEVSGVARLLADNYDDERLRANFVDLVLQLAVEQPLKTPFAAAVVLVVNTLTHKPPPPPAAAANGGGDDGLDTSMENGGQDQPAAAAEPQPTSGVVDDLLAKAAAQVEEKVRLGEWRAVKLYLKLLACLQGCLEGDGVFPILEDLFNQAVELQTANNEDTIGTELVKIILLTIPYAVAAAPDKTEKLATELLDKTEVIAGEPHALQNLIDPFHPEADEKSPAATMSFLGLLQTQLQAEASSGWKLSCLPRPWKMPLEEVEQQEKLDNCPTHKLPAITIPETLIAGPRPLFPEIFFSVYLGQDIESVPPVTTISSSLIRDNLVDTINVLHFNRTVAARRLIDIDNYFAEGTFVSRATPFDQIRDVPPGKSTWKPEDVVVDAVFSQLFILPTPEQKLIYYHSVLTEACRIAPAAIAPSFGRAIRFLYRNIGLLDIELGQRFTDWFSHHLSNFGFTWKWTEWTADVKLPNLHPCKAFIMGAIDKEIRLSFAGRIRKTLPEGYQELVPPEKDVEEPPFKFEKDDTPFAQEGRELAQLLKRKASDEDIQPVIERIHSLAIDQGLDPLVASTDVFTTAVLSIGSKSLSHVLAAIERTKDRLMDAGATSEPARAQIITAVMDFWSAHPGVAITIIEKLLNYSIVSPSAVVQWALVRHAGETRGEALARSHIYELVFNTINKVTKRMREVVASSSSSNTTSAPEGGEKEGEGGGEDTAMATSELEDAKRREAQAARELFRTTQDAVVAWATGAKDELMEDAGGLTDAEREERDRAVRRWGDRWLRVVRRRAAIEETFLLEAEKTTTKA